MAFPRWLQPLLDAEQSRAADTWAIEAKGIPSAQLMERAGEGLAQIVTERHPAGRVVVVCGKGSNGGDGIVAARLLRQAGREVDVLAVRSPQYWSRDARAQVLRLPGEQPLEYDADRLQKAAVIVDALLGTGFADAPRDPLPQVIADVNAASAPVIACDIPTGVDASTGAVEGAAVEAEASVTFHRGKPGHWIAPGKWHTGRLYVVDIGIPRGAPGEPDFGLITPNVVRKIPPRTVRSTKFDSGVVFVIGGSPGLTGAPAMAAMAAMRSGAGYVTIGAPESLVLTVEAHVLEVMTVGLEDEERHLSERALDDTLAAISRAQSVILGPGIGRRDDTRQLVGELAERIDVPLVLDADGLNAFAGRIDELAHRRFPTVLTPHTGELGRLLDCPREHVEEHRLECVREAAARSRQFVVLKGDDTLVASPKGRTAVNVGRAPALATAGTGDVLSGVIGTMLAKGLPPAQAACAAVYLHARAGRIAAEPHGPDAVIASDVIAALPQALKH